MKIFITGATGYIGELLALELANEGNKLSALIRDKQKAQKLKHPNISTVVGDLFDKEVLAEAMQGKDAVFHLAACASICPQPGAYQKVNVEGTRNILEAAVQTGIKKLIFTSTAGVAGPSLSGEAPVNEDTERIAPFFNEYESSKAEAEKLVLSYKDRLEVVILRPSRVYGPGEASESNAITRMMKLYMAGKWRIIPGDGKKVGNYVHVNDVVLGHKLALDHAPNGATYFLGGENASYHRLFQCMAEATKKRRNLFRLPVPLMIAVSYLMVAWAWITRSRPLITPAWVRKYMWHWAISSDKAIRELGYRITPLEAGLRQTAKAIGYGDDDGKYALITGASSGIGKAVAERLASSNKNLILSALPGSGLKDQASALKERYDVDIRCIEIDLTMADAAEKVHKWYREDPVPLNMLINNAGVGSICCFEKTPLSEIRHMMSLNIDATVMLCRLFIPELKQHARSYILNIGSLASKLPVPYKCVYSGSKSFVYMFSKALRTELKPDDIHVSCLCPGPVNTNAEMVEQHEKLGWKGKLIVLTPEEVAKKALKGLHKRSAIIIPGYLNKMAIFTQWILPPFLLDFILDRAFKKKVQSSVFQENDLQKRLSDMSGAVQDV